jgi:hypothetical protein
MVDYALNIRSSLVNLVDKGVRSIVKEVKKNYLGEDDTEPLTGQYTAPVSLELADDFLGLVSESEGAVDGIFS